MHVRLATSPSVVSLDPNIRIYRMAVSIVLYISQCIVICISAVSTYLCISFAEPLSPLHSNTLVTVKATRTNIRVRNTNLRTCWYGGSRALADFQVTPPLGSSMVIGMCVYVDVDVRQPRNGWVEGICAPAKMQNERSARANECGDARATQDRCCDRQLGSGLGDEHWSLM